MLQCLLGSGLEAPWIFDSEGVTSANKGRGSDQGGLLKLGFFNWVRMGQRDGKRMLSGSKCAVVHYGSELMLACFSDNRLTGWQKPKAHNVRLTWHGTRYATHIVSEAQWYSDPHQVSSYILRFYLAYFLIFWRMFSYIMWDMFWYVSAHVFWHVHRHSLCHFFAFSETFCPAFSCTIFFGILSDPTVSLTS